MNSLECCAVELLCKVADHLDAPTASDVVAAGGLSLLLMRVLDDQAEDADVLRAARACQQVTRCAEGVLGAVGGGAEAIRPRSPDTTIVARLGTGGM